MAPERIKDSRHSIGNVESVTSSTAVTEEQLRSDTHKSKITILLCCSTLGKDPKYWGEVPERLEKEGYAVKIVMPDSYKMNDYRKKIEKAVQSGGPFVLVPFSNADMPATIATDVHPSRVIGIVYVDSVLRWKENPRSDQMLADLGTVLEKLPAAIVRKISSSKVLVGFLLEGMIENKLPKDQFNELVKITARDGDAIKAVVETKRYSEKVERERHLSWEEIIENLMHSHVKLGSIVSTKETKEWAKELILYEEVLGAGHLSMLEKLEDFMHAFNKVLVRTDLTSIKRKG